MGLAPTGGGETMDGNIEFSEAQREEVRSEREVDAEDDGPDQSGEGERFGVGVLSMDSESSMSG